MRKIFTFLAALLATFSLSAETIFSFTVTSATTAVGEYTAEGGAAKCTNAMATGGSNEVTIGSQTFYKFNSSSAWEFTLADGNFEVDDVIAVTCACSSAKSGKGIKLNDAIVLTGDFAESTPNTLTYTVVAGDGIVGTNKVTVKRNDADIKFGTFAVNREAVTTDPVLKVSKDSIDVFVTPIQATPSVKVTFSGKNLTPGTYNLTIPNLAGLTVAPQSVTVGSDGKLSAEVTISYTSAVDVATAATEISLTINEQVAKVTVTYGAMSAFCGELIKATTQQVVTGLIGGTVATNLSKGDSKKLDKNKYFGIQLAGGATFAEGDIFVMNITAAAGSAESMGTMKIYADNAGTQKLYESTDVGVEGENSWELPAAVAGKTALYVYRGGGNDWNPTFSYISVTRDCSTEPKLAVSPASVNLKATTAEPADTAVVTFSGKRLTPGTYNLTIPNLAGLTVAPQSVTVGEDGKLNAEVTIAYTSSVDVAAGVANIALTIDELNATVAVNYVAKMTKQYVTSLNLEQLVLDNGTKGGAGAALDAANIDYSNIDQLDSLNADKDYNNYPFLGLKLKKTNASLGFWLKQGSTAKFRVGNVGANFLWVIDGVDSTMTNAVANMQATSANVFSYTAADADARIEIICNSTSTLVIKQIMIDEDIQPVTVEPGKDPTKDDDATIKVLTINGDTITPQGTTFAYEVPAALDLAEVEVVYELNSAKATGNPASGFKVAVPAAGAAANEQTLIVTAESGDKAEYTISVTHAEPEIVTAAEIQGEANAYVGEEQTLTCVAEHATIFQWYQGANAIDGATQATYKFTPDTAGEYTFACEASNEFTATPVRSADFTVTATVRPPQPQVLVLWDAVEANRIGVITYGASGVEEGEVKIHKNADKIKGIKLGNSYNYSDGKYVTFKPSEGGFEEGDTVFVAICYNSDEEKNAAVALYGADGAELLFTSQQGVNGRSSADDPVVEAYVLQDDADSLFIGRSGNTSTYITVLKVIRPIEVIGNPVLKVSKDTVNLFATLAQANPSVKVTFTGKHLTPGTYNLTIPNLAGLTVNPQSVTVGEDGKLNAEVTIAYTSSVDVAAGMVDIALTIDELSAQVAVNYSAKMSKNYATSLNFEQLVMDQGKGADINAILDSHYIDYNNIDQLDSLNGSKDYNNYPFLGLKLKKEDASLGFWLRQGSKVNLKFGNIGADFNVYFGDGVMPVTSDMANKQPSDSLVVSCDPVAADTYVSIVCGSTKTLVIKQIMIDEDIQPVNVDPGVDPSKDSDATIKSLSINGVAITREGTTFAYEVPADVNLAEVEVVYELNSAKATGNPASGFKVAVPEAGAAANEQTLTVTAESGAQVEYTISVTRAESQGLFDLDTTVPATKLIRNGRLLIIKNNRTYTVLGQAL